MERVLRWLINVTCRAPRRHVSQEDGLSASALGPFLCLYNGGTGEAAPILFRRKRKEIGMSHWRNRNPAGTRFRAYLFEWAIAVGALFGTLILLSLHQHA
jgi:hypothetical protein